MRIIIPCETDELLDAPRSGHFGHAPWLIVAELDESNNIVSCEAVKNVEHGEGGCGNVIAHALALGADAIIAAGMGRPPLTRFTQAGMAVYIDREVPLAGDVLKRFIAGELQRMTLDDACNHDHHDSNPNLQELFLVDDGVRLHAKLEVPDGFTHGSLAIVFHGLTGHMEERHIVAVSEAIRAAGVATLRVELYGHGQSDGEFAEHTLYKWINNALAVVDTIKTQDFVDRIYLCGHSQGGLLTILLAGMRPQDFAAIIPMSPALVIVDGSRKGSLLGMEFDPLDIPDMLPFPKGGTLNGNYFRVAQTLNPEQAMARYTGPVLLLHGTDDQAVFVSYSEEAHEQFADARLVLLDGDDHCYNKHLDLVCDEVKEFLEGLEK